VGQQPQAGVAGKSPGRARQRRTTRRGCAVREPADPRAPATQTGSRATVTVLESRLVAERSASRKTRAPASKQSRQAGKQATQ